MNKRRRYLLNKILNQNADISYTIIKESSVSVEGREDVRKFRGFIEKNYNNGRVLDLGCGPLTWPYYLPRNIKEPFGIDPKPSDFKGAFVVGVAERMPFENHFFNDVVCATSLDHMLDVDRAIAEVARVLKSHGKFLVWCNKELSPKVKAKVAIKKYLNYIVPRYWETGNGYVFEIPRGAMDAFHIEYLSPNKLRKICRRNGLVETSEELHDTNLYLCFEKGRCTK